MPTFPYDPSLLGISGLPVASVSDVLQLLETIDATCADGDGLKWFNALYLEVTRSVSTRVAAGGFSDLDWLSALDVEFAKLYFGALRSALSGGACPECWKALLGSRDRTGVARIQFALAGINAHINHDLAQALVTTGSLRGVPPRHGSPQYQDYTSLNSTLASLIDTARVLFHVRLLGDPLPPVTHLEDTIAAWNVAAAREQAWTNAEVLWQLRNTAPLADGFMRTLDGLSTVAGKALLVPVPQA